MTIFRPVPGPAPLDTSPFDRVLVIDANVVLESHPLETRDWSSISPGSILLLVCGQVMNEIDRKKQDGRLGSKARSFMRFLKAARSAGKPVSISPDRLEVFVSSMHNRTIDWTKLDFLEPDSGDDRIVAQTIHAHVDDPGRIEIFSYDLRPREKGGAYGIADLEPPEEWRLPAAASAKDREIASLTKQLAEYKKAEPTIEITIHSLSPSPLERLVVERPSPEQVDAMAAAVLGRVPIVPQPGNMLADITYRAEAAADADWRATTRSKVLPMAHRGLERMFGQHALEIEIANVGDLGARDVRLEVQSGNAVLHDRPYLVDVLGDLEDDDNQEDASSWFARLPEGHFDHDPLKFQSDGEEPGRMLGWRCEDFRPRRRSVITVFVDLSQTASKKLQIEVELTCANMRGVLKQHVPFCLETRRVGFGDLVDVRGGRLARPSPISDRLASWTKPRPRTYRNDGSTDD